VMQDPRIVGIAWGVLEGVRPRPAGSNARLGPHGRTVRVPLVRLLDEEGASGFGWSRAQPAQADALLGRRLSDVFSPASGAADDARPFDFALWDLAARRSRVPVYALAAGTTPPTALHVACYDTSLYFDDLHLQDDIAAAALIAAEAREGHARGHRAFKIKVGRGARHMAPDAGLQRDIAVVRAVRQAVGPDARLMLDANNGYTLNLAKHVLEATADCAVVWLEEAFHEDDVLYRDLRAWLASSGLATLIADGEGAADPRLLGWARDGLVDVVQFDIFDRGFTGWLTLGRTLDEWGTRSAPHHYGGHYGNFVAGHLAAAVRGFTFVEWDEATVAGLDTSAYQVTEGRVAIPAVPGFGLELDVELFTHAAGAGGYERGVPGGAQVR
jgi:L-rhamnonate dehydratase